MEGELKMSKAPYKSFVTTSRYYRVSGWGILKLQIDDKFTMWMAETLTLIEEHQRYDYDLFIDYVGWMPIYFFADAKSAWDFCKMKSNHYPIDKMMKDLRYQPEYWFSTIANTYIDYMLYLKSQESLYRLKTKTHRI